MRISHERSLHGKQTIIHRRVGSVLSGNRHHACIRHAWDRGLVFLISLIQKVCFESRTHLRHAIHDRGLFRRAINHPLHSHADRRTLRKLAEISQVHCIDCPGYRVSIYLGKSVLELRHYQLRQQHTTSSHNQGLHPANASRFPERAWRSLWRTDRRLWILNPVEIVFLKYPKSLWYCGRFNCHCRHVDWYAGKNLFHESCFFRDASHLHHQHGY